MQSKTGTNIYVWLGEATLDTGYLTHIQLKPSFLRDGRQFPGIPI